MDSNNSTETIVADDCEVLNVIRLSDVEKLAKETLIKLSVPPSGVELRNVMLRIIDSAQPSKKSRVDFHSLLFVEEEVLKMLQNLTINDLQKVVG